MSDQALVRRRLTQAEVSAIRIVLDGLPSENSRRAYERALMDFFLWHRGVGCPQLNKAVVQRYAAELRDAGMAPSSVNQRLSAIRKLALEAADNGALDTQVASGIRAVKGARRQRIKSFLMRLAVPTSTSPLIEAISAERCPGIRLFG